MTRLYRSVAAILGLLAASLPLQAQDMPGSSDIPPRFTAPKAGYDYVKRVEMVPMRDGVKLYTVIVTPKGVSHTPILLTRTPYDAMSRAKQTESPHMRLAYPRLCQLYQPAGGALEAGTERTAG